MPPPILTPVFRLVPGGNGVPVPNGFLPGGFSIDRLQRQSHLDELLAVCHDPSSFRNGFACPATLAIRLRTLDTSGST